MSLVYISVSEFKNSAPIGAIYLPSGGGGVCSLTEKKPDGIVGYNLFKNVVTHHDDTQEVEVQVTFLCVSDVIDKSKL